MGNPEDFLSNNAVALALAVFVIIVILRGVYIVPQSQKFVVERLGRLRAVLGPGVNLIVPFLDRVAHKVSVLERQLPSMSQDAITSDNVTLSVETSVFYRITEPERTVYRIRDVDGAIRTTVAGIVRSEIGRMELDTVQSNRSVLIETIRSSLLDVVEDWGIEVTRVEILDVSLDEATRAAMLQQLNAERARRAQVTEAEGAKRAAELRADAELYTAEQDAKARRILADAEAYATGIMAEAIAKNGLEAAQYQVALKQVEALEGIGKGTGRQTVILPAAALDALSDAFKMFKGKA
jgi:regulator of protease activity HflC (stomatin/prohibitin superfamily)